MNPKILKNGSEYFEYVKFSPKFEKKARQSDKSLKFRTRCEKGSRKCGEFPWTLQNFHGL